MAQSAETGFAWMYLRKELGRATLVGIGQAISFGEHDLSIFDQNERRTRYVVFGMFSAKESIKKNSRVLRIDFVTRWLGSRLTFGQRSRAHDAKRDAKQSGRSRIFALSSFLLAREITPRKNNST
jgi:hypothetical protein